MEKISNYIDQKRLAGDSLNEKANWFSHNCCCQTEKQINNIDEKGGQSWTKLMTRSYK